MNEECCENCIKNHQGQEVGMEWPLCTCHTNKGEKKCICYGDMDEGHRKTCPLFTAPTQPESSWEQRFQEQFGGPIKGWRDAITTFPEVTQFIRTEIEAAEERGKMKVVHATMSFLQF